MFTFILNLIANIFGTQNERELKKFDTLVEDVNSLEDEIVKLTDDEVKERAAQVKKILQTRREEIEPEVEQIRESISTSTSDVERNKHKKALKEKKNSIFNDKMAEVFAIVREASKRTISLRHFDVQLIGGAVLHQGNIAEMTTGEGKTLVATLPACLNAISGESVHVVTVNDYLAKRDSEWMSPIYNFLGLSVGVIQNSMQPDQRKKAYACDIVYGTNNEFGFDYLRDNMVADSEDMVQSHQAFAIVDEVDSILIDEARTPLIISGPVDETNESYNEMRPVVQDIVAAQKRLIRDYIEKFHDAYGKDDKKDDAGQFLYLVHKADPKNRDFLDIVLKDATAKNIFDKTQTMFEGKTMEKERDVLLEELYYVFDEKTREATFSTRGQELMRDRFKIEFMLEDIEAKLAELADEEIEEDEKTKRQTELVAAYSEQQKTVESIKQLLKAYILFQKDVDYVIKENKVVIVDGFTGRMMPGRRFSDGIHEAIEAKERVEVQRESQTLATVTLQNYFRMYDKLSGMTGTAKTEEAEFISIYLLPVVQIPTNCPLKRDSMPDRIYKTEKEKFQAAIDDIAEMQETGRPVLVGTISIEKSEQLSRLLTEKGVKHNVLNAKQHEREAHIIAQAGRFEGVTIATNMAGRGTDIVLGGNAEDFANEEVGKLNIDDPEERERVFQKFYEEAQNDMEQKRTKVLETGGLHIIGTERHEARRIDDQLRGRSGRQGDPGSSRFYLSLEDDLMRIFGSDRIKSIMDRLGMEEGEVIENPLVTGAVRTAQKRVEAQNFEIRKHLLKYDNVMNQQREVIYKRRRMILKDKDLKEEFFECLNVGLESILEGWETNPDAGEVSKQIMYNYAMNIKSDLLEGKSAKDIVDLALEVADKNYNAREKFLTKDRMHELEKMVMLSVIDSNWKEYLREIDDLREGISWRAYAQKDPLIEFQHEAFKMFTELMIKIDEQTAERIMKISAMEEQYRKNVYTPDKEKFQHQEYSALGNSSTGQDNFYNEGPKSAPMPGGITPAPRPEANKETVKREGDKVGRNDPCTCGSGKKYKKCCGK